MGSSLHVGLIRTDSPAEPSPSERPVSVGSAGGNAERGRGLVGGKTGEVAELHQFRLLRVLFGKSVECLVKCEHFVIGGWRGNATGAEWFALALPAVLDRLLAARLLDE
jgi:hypothetical protein